MDCEDGEKQQLFQQFDISLPATSVMLHDYSGAVSVSSVQEPSRCAAQCQTYQDVSDHSVQTDQVICAGGLSMGKSAGTQTDIVNDQYVSLKYEHIQHSDETIRSYTGLPNDATFQTLFEEIPKPDDICFNSGRKCVLRMIDQLFMTLMRLKLGLVLTDLSFRFGISKATCSKIINKWIDHLYIHLSFLTYWPTREQINNTMPSDFKENFPRTRVVIDCTELFTETPQSLSEQSLMFSHYKTHMTWKALIGITPNGVVSFVSDFWQDQSVISKW